MTILPYVSFIWKSEKEKKKKRSVDRDLPCSALNKLLEQKKERMKKTLKMNVQLKLMIQSESGHSGTHL